MDMEMSSKYCLNSFYEDANIFITGATGFLGKLLVRKLLSTFPKINKIYIVIRSKNGVSAETRINEYCNIRIFHGLSSSCPDFKNKICGVSGDITLPNLGLSDTDVALLQQEVQIVFHSAASVRINEPLETGLQTNTKSVLRLLYICNGMKQLKCILHVSTVYSHSNLLSKPLKEEFMASKIKYQNIIQLVDLLDSDTLSKITPALIEPWIREYSLTKYLAENISWESHLPVGIFRPGIVISTYKDPVPGWTDNLYVAMGISALTQSGILRCMKGCSELNSHVVPADWCVNAMIVAAVEVYETQKISFDKLVYNYCSDNNPLTWRQFFGKIQLGMKYPLKDAVWLPMLFLISSDLGFKIVSFFLHYLPAHICDLFLLINGKPTRYAKNYKKLESSYLNVISPAFTQTFCHKVENVHLLWNRLSIEDRQRLPFHLPDLSWDDYFKLYIRGIGKYAKNQKNKDLPQARRKYLLFRTINNIIILVLPAVVLMSLRKVASLMVVLGGKNTV